MSLDPVLQKLVEQLPQPAEGPLNYPEMREQSEAILPLIVGPAGVAQVHSVEERAIQGLHGDVPIRIYRPQGPSRGTLHYIHGGGWCLGNLAMTDPIARRLCSDLEMVIVSSTYRLAPEHPFPAAYEDALAAAVWVRDHADALGGPGLPVAIGGDSAGGNLAAAVCIGLREEDDAALGLSGPHARSKPFDLQLLLYPATDLRPSSWELPSRIADSDPGLRSRSLRELYPTYIGDGDPADWRMSPLAAEDLSNLPPAIIVVLEVDPLRDEAVGYAERLQAAGVPAELIEFDNLIHGFAHMSAIVPAASDALQVVLARFKSTLAANAER